jgi:hypothetical protein
MKDEERRSLALPPVKVNAAERSLIEANAKAAHLSVSAWQRYAALKQNPPRPRVITAIAQEQWFKLGAELQELHRLRLYFLAEGEGRVVAKLERVESELKAVRDRLIGVEP